MAAAYLRIKAFWRGLPDGCKRTLHTLWQVAVPVFLSHILIARSSADVKASFVITGAAVLAAAKALLVS